MRFASRCKVCPRLEPAKSPQRHQNSASQLTRVQSCLAPQPLRPERAGGSAPAGDSSTLPIHCIPAATSGSGPFLVGPLRRICRASSAPAWSELGVCDLFAFGLDVGVGLSQFQLAICPKRPKSYMSPIQSSCRLSSQAKKAWRSFL